MESPAYGHWNTNENQKLPDTTQIDPSFQTNEYAAAEAVAVAAHTDVTERMGTRTSRRPLSQSKRAQQNRAAQRAFRQRKELYIKDLESKVQELKGVKDTMEALRAENQELRDYILALQSRWINQPGGVPSPPAAYARAGGDDLEGVHYSGKDEDK